MEEWTKDSPISKEKLDIESIQVPILHGKYLSFLSKERIFLHTLMREKKKLSSILEDYYSGHIDGRDIGREPFQGVIKTASGIQAKVDSDKSIVDINLKIALVEENILYLKEVLDSIKQRQWNIRNSIEFMKFMSGASL